MCLFARGKIVVTMFGLSNVSNLVRPPGHHAGRYGTTAGCNSTGFCLFNNAAIAAVYSR
jgi:acetoin utilization deacetylase AcuC-like enzyme